MTLYSSLANVATLYGTTFRTMAITSLSTVLTAQFLVPFTIGVGIYGALHLQEIEEPRYGRASHQELALQYGFLAASLYLCPAAIATGLAVYALTAVVAHAGYLTEAGGIFHRLHRPKPPLQLYDSLFPALTTFVTLGTMCGFTNAAILFTPFVALALYGGVANYLTSQDTDQSFISKFARGVNHSHGFDLPTTLLPVHILAKSAGLAL